ncbi:polysaccharide pyruvyl transferase family protein [Ornithinimicrobium ciconiae]
MLPSEFAGYVWGAGSLHGQPLALPEAQFLAVRGELTRELVDAPGDPALGDPGILVSHFLPRPPLRWRVGIVPHHFHEDDTLWDRLAIAAGPAVRVIDVRRGPTAVLRDIARCAAIVSTSLHGLITADAYGIPAVWTRRAPDLWGGRFKFDDYESVLTPGRTRMVDVDDDVDLDAIVRFADTVDAQTVQQRQRGLLRALATADLPRLNPLTAPAHVLSRR